MTPLLKAIDKESLIPKKVETHQIIDGLSSSIKLLEKINLFEPESLEEKFRDLVKPIKYFENKGSAQCKSTVIFGAMRTEGTTYIKAKKSRNHTELLCKYLNLPLKEKKKMTVELNQ